MRCSDLFEAPIGNLEVHNMDQAGTFSASDRRLLTNPQHIAKIKRRFELADHDFNIYFINQPGVDYLRDLEREDDDDPTPLGVDAFFTARFGDDLETLNGLSSHEAVAQRFKVAIARDPSAVTFVLISNASDENAIAITPWIVAHRIGHAIIESNDKSVTGSFVNYANAEMMKLGREKKPLRQLLTMRSARLGQLTNETEMMVELVAQYLIQGSIRLQGEKTDPVINQVARRVDRAFTKMFDACLGHVFIGV